MTLDELFEDIENTMSGWIYDHGIDNMYDDVLHIGNSDARWYADRYNCWKEIYDWIVEYCDPDDIMGEVECEDEEDDRDFRKYVEEMDRVEAIGLVDTWDLVQILYNGFDAHFGISDLIRDAKDALEDLESSTGVDKLYAALAACHVYHANGRLVADHSYEIETGKFAKQAPEPLSADEDYVIKLATEGLEGIFTREEIMEWLREQEVVA